MSSQDRIAVIGAGIVGLSCALWLQRKGFSVTLIDSAEPGSGTSSGNAGTIATYGCVPINSPNLFTRLPRLMLSADSPLRIDPVYAATHPAWMLQFLLNCRRQRVARITRLLGKLLTQVYAGLDPLLDMAAAQDLLESRGFMHVYADRAEFDAAQAANRARREQGANFIELSRADIRDLEPALKFPFKHGLLFDDVKQVLDPQALSRRYFECFQQHQGDFRGQCALEVRHGVDAVQVGLANGERIDARRIVVAAGAFSKTIEGVPMQRLPLDCERGYHVQFSNQQHLLSRPVSWQQAGFYATPMTCGLRFAGTVEIAGLKTRKNPHIVDYLTRKARQMLDLPPKPDQTWLGFRPTCPDSLPVIGYSTVSEYILFAFGHHHLGLTLSGITGKLIAELVNGEQPSHNIKPFSPRRFL